MIFLRPKRSLLRDALFLTGVHLFLHGVSLAFGAFLSRRLGAGGMGLWQLILSAGGLAATLGCAGVRTAAAFLSAEELGRGRPGGVRSAVECCAVYGLSLSALSGTLLFCLSGVIARQALRAPEAAGALRIFALFLPAGCLCAVLSGCFTACGRIRRLAALEIAEELASLLLVFWLLGVRRPATAAESCRAIALAGGLAELAAAAAQLLLFRRDCRARPRERVPMASRLLRLCVPLGLSECLRAALSALEQFLIPWGLAQYGLSRAAALSGYGVLRGMVFPLLLFPAALLFSLSELLVPELARQRAAGHMERVRALVKSCLGAGFVYAACAAGLLLALARPLGLLVYKSEEAGRQLQLFAPLVLILYPDALADALNKGLGRQTACARISLFASVLDVLLLRLLLPRLGLAGFYFSFAGTRLLNSALTLRLLRRASGVPADLGPAVRGTVCAAAAAGACFLLPAPASPALCALLRLAVCGLLLPPLLRLSGALEPRDRERLLRALPLRGDP